MDAVECVSVRKFYITSQGCSAVLFLKDVAPHSPTLTLQEEKVVVVVSYLSHACTGAHTDTVLNYFQHYKLIHLLSLGMEVNDAPEGEKCNMS